MPKVISRAAISSSTDAKPTPSSVASLSTYYCLCGEYLLVLDKNLFTLPRRKTDEATAIRSRNTDKEKARIFKLNAHEGGAVIIQRENGYERQWRYLCPRCSLPIAYQMTAPPAKASFLYIIRGSLTQYQGEIPPDAFVGE